MSTTLAELGQEILDVDGPDAGDVQMWSVTTIIGALDKPALLYWSAEEAAKAAVKSERTWKAMLEEQGEAEAVKWLRDARFRRQKGLRSATELGTAVHEACEQYALTGIKPDVDDEVRPFLDQFDGWLDRFQPSYQATEVVVFHPQYGYAGTTDAFLTLEGVPLIVDYKSSRKNVDARGQLTGPYPEVALQLAGYRHAQFAAVWRPRRFEKFRRRYYLLSEAERALAVPVPEVEGGLCIHITPERCEAYPVRCDESVFESFLFVLEAARWSFESSKHAIGGPIDAPEREAVSA